MEEELKLFHDYLSNFDMNNPKIKHKYEHTNNVINYSKEISRSLNLNEKEISRAAVSALFHDIGRFPQARDYNTFDDSKSFDHGDKGYEILKELGYKDEIVLNSVKYHNKKDLPKFDELTDLHLKIVRDADKIDIMINFLKDPINSDYIIDKEIMESFKNHKLLTKKGTDTDYMIGLRYLAFFFDINYKKTVEILLENNVLDIKLNILRNSKNKEQLDFIEQEIKNYLKERFDVLC